MMKRVSIIVVVALAAALMCVLSGEALGQQPVGTAENDANIDTANVYVGIKNANPQETYCVVKDGAIVATLNVVTTVGDFGAVMRITPKEAAAKVKKGDSVYLKREAAQLQRPTPTPLVPMPVVVTPTLAPPIVSEQPRSPFIMASPTPLGPYEPTPMPPAPVVPALPPLNVGQPEGARPPQEEGAIIVDNEDPGAIVQQPELSWVKSTDATSAYGNNSLTTILRNPQTVSVTFLATIPQDGNYEISLWWVASTERYRSKRVPVTVHTMDGDVKLTIDQTTGNAQFNSIGRFNLKAGEREPIVTISNEGINKLDRGYISADAVKIVYRGPVQK
jgi:hypothetical protein